jgi:hypothetical protein
MISRSVKHFAIAGFEMLPVVIKSCFDLSRCRAGPKNKIVRKSYLHN